MKVMKFGGSSLRDGESMLRVGGIVAADEEARVIVVSAVQGVTDSLIDFISAKRKEDEVQHFMSDLRSRHLNMLGEVSKGMATKQAAISGIMERLVKLERVLYGIAYLEELTPRTRDLVQSFGERLSAILVTAMLQDMGVNAVTVEADVIGIETDGNYGMASALLDRTRENIHDPVREMLDRGEVPVVTGFFGLTPNGHVAVFGRNGTDYSASVIANAIGADAVEIWKDVDGFMSVDPKVVPDAVPLSELSYDEAAELSYFGAHILHPRTVEPAKAASLEVRVKNVFSPQSPGSRIRPSGVEMASSVKSISSMSEMTIIKAYGAGAGYSEGVLAEISAGLRDADINIYSAATSQTCISLLIKKTDKARALGVLDSSRKGVINNIEAMDDVALVCIVGEKLGFRKGIAAKVFTAVAEADVNVAMISAGASTVAYQFVVDQGDLRKTIMAIHDEFFGEGR